MTGWRGASGWRSDEPLTGHARTGGQRVSDNPVDTVIKVGAVVVYVAGLVTVVVLLTISKPWWHRRFHVRRSSKGCGRCVRRSAEEAADGVDEVSEKVEQHD